MAWGCSINCRRRIRSALRALIDPHLWAAPRDMEAAGGAAVIGERRDSDQGGGGFAAERAQFRQPGQHRGAEHLAHPGKLRSTSLLRRQASERRTVLSMSSSIWLMRPSR